MVGLDCWNVVENDVLAASGVGALAPPVGKAPVPANVEPPTPDGEEPMPENTELPPDGLEPALAPNVAEPDAAAGF